jgi:hypothetical protein
MSREIGVGYYRIDLSDAMTDHIQVEHFTDLVLQQVRLALGTQSATAPNPFSPTAQFVQPIRIADLKNPL